MEAAKISAASGQLTPVSMLGDTQRDWWKNQLRASATTWNLWGNEVLLRMQFNGAQAVAGLLARGLAAANNALTPLVPAMANALVQDLTGADHSSGKPVTAYPALSALLAAQAGIPAGAFAAQIKPLLDAQLPPSALLDEYLLNADQWDGYNAERKHLMAFVRDTGIRNLVALTGDIHAFFAGPVMDDYDAAMPKPIMVDLVTAGISSNSFFSYFKNVVDNDPAFAQAKPLIYSEERRAHQHLQRHAQAVQRRLAAPCGHRRAGLRRGDSDSRRTALRVQQASRSTASRHPRYRRWRRGRR